MEVVICLLAPEQITSVSVIMAVGLIWLLLDCVILPAPVPKLALAAALPVPSHNMWPSPTHLSLSLWACLE